MSLLRLLGTRFINEISSNHVPRSLTGTFFGKHPVEYDTLQLFLSNLVPRCLFRWLLRNTHLGTRFVVVLACRMSVRPGYGGIHFDLK
jgi:uncharacterized membrane protein YjdF